MVKPLRIAFVGMKRPPSDMPEGYWPSFIRYHLELPYYYARFSRCYVDVVSTEPVVYNEDFTADSGGTLRCITETEYLAGTKGEYDVVVHWRKWNDDLYDLFSRNIMLSQDHSYSTEWLSAVKDAIVGRRLDGILVFPTWHKSNTARELAAVGTSTNLYEGMSLGVDTSVYEPISKDPYHLLWASDPGRGLDRLAAPFLNLWKMDRRFRLTVTYPDYVKPESLARFSQFLSHPGVQRKPSLRNGPELWSLFNSAGFLSYSSTFPEPSSRCHRQAMAAGSVVLYPPNMGTPSELIEHNLTGIVEQPELWPDTIISLVKSGRWQEIGQNARAFAVSENWAVQAKRFYTFFSKGLA